MSAAYDPDVRSGARRQVVDAITLVRVPLALALPILPVRFRGPVLALAVGTDVVDGGLARSWGVASPDGARLDSIADAVLVAGASVAAIGTVEPARRRTIAAGAGGVAVVRGITLVVTRRRFGRWSIAHTRANKASGALLGVVAVRALFVGRLSGPGLAVAAGVAAVAAVEELAIAVAAERFDPDVAGFRRRGA